MACRSITATACAASASPAIVFGVRVISSPAVSVRMSAARPSPRRRSPSVTTPTSGAVGVDHGRHAEPLARHLDERVLAAARPPAPPAPALAVHEVLDPQQPPAERRRPDAAARSPQRRSRAPRAAPPRARRPAPSSPSCSPSARGRADTPPRGRSRRARRRRRAQRRRRRSGDRDQRHAEPAQQRQEAQHLVGLAAVRDRDQDVAALEHAEVAVAAFAGVQEERRRAGAGERRGDLRGRRCPTCRCR